MLKTSGFFYQAESSNDNHFSTQNEILRLQKQLNEAGILPKKAYRRDFHIYELVCYINNITGCYISGNYEPIPILIERAKGYLSKSDANTINQEYCQLVKTYLAEIEKQKDLCSID